jgi:hypothetical protein
MQTCVVLCNQQRANSCSTSTQHIAMHISRHSCYRRHTAEPTHESNTQTPHRRYTCAADRMRGCVL